MWGLRALYVPLNTRFFVQILFVGDDFEKMQYVAIVAELYVSYACSARQHLNLRVKEDSSSSQRKSTYIGENHKSSRSTSLAIREFKHDVYGRWQTANVTSDFLSSSCNP